MGCVDLQDHGVANYTIPLVNTLDNALIHCWKLYNRINEMKI